MRRTIGPGDGGQAPAAPNGPNETLSAYDLTTAEIDIDQFLEQAAADISYYAPPLQQQQLQQQHRHTLHPQHIGHGQQPRPPSFTQPVTDQPYVLGGQQYSPYNLLSVRQCQPCISNGVFCRLAPATPSQPFPGCLFCLQNFLVCELSFYHAQSSQPAPFGLVQPHSRTSLSSHSYSNLGTLQSQAGGTLALNSDAVESDVQTGELGTSSKVGTRFSRETVDILRQWLLAHQDHPYPTEDEKDEIQTRTGLSRIQITNWLANARRRGIVGSSGVQTGAGSSNSSPAAAEFDRPRDAGNPLERWKNLPLEQEPVAVSDIERAVSTSDHSPGFLSTAYPASDFSMQSMAASTFMVPSQDPGLSAVSQGSPGSHRSQSSFGSFRRRSRHRRRQTVKGSAIGGSGRDVRQYQCTFCTESFRTKHDWQRHEKSLHLSLERWICAPHGGTVLVDGQAYCVFCGASDGSADHMDTHNYASCLERSQEERTFYRKDHLRQHLRLVHGCRLSPDGLDQWKMSISHVQSRCGFCGQELRTWNARVEHLAEHFKTGMTMEQWSGGHGFEPHIQQLVEDAAGQASESVAGAPSEEAPASSRSKGKGKARER